MATSTDITKSEKGFFGGLIASKKFGLAGAWATACLVVVEMSISTSAAVTIAALASGALVVASYVISQAMAEGGVAKVRAFHDPSTPTVTASVTPAISVATSGTSST